VKKHECVAALDVPTAAAVIGVTTDDAAITTAAAGGVIVVTAEGPTAGNAGCGYDVTTFFTA
jgi:hypothetical protein